MKFNLRKSSAFLLIGFSGLYITKITSFSPLYYGLILSFLSFFPLFFNSNIRLDKVFFSSFFTFLYILINSIYFDKIFEARNWLIGYIMFLLAYLILQGITFEYLKKITKFFINISLLLLIIECAVRLLYPETNTNLIEEGEETWNSAYKLNSIMFDDSNSVGIYILCLFFLVYYLIKKFDLNYTKQIILLAILSFLTFSKGTIGAIVLSLILFKYKKQIIKYRKTAFLLGIPLTIITYVSYLYIAESFSSMQQRINIFITYLNYINSHPSYFWFGGGAHSEITIIGRGAHILILVLLTGVGLIGSLVFFYNLYIVNKYSNYKAYILIIPFFINGLLFGEPVSYFLIPLVLIYNFEKFNYVQLE